MATAPDDDKQHLLSTPLPKEMSRADFLKGGGALVVGFTMAGSLLTALSPQALAAGASAPTLPTDTQTTPALDAWLAVLANNTVNIYQSKVELGAGEITALAQIAAEELYLPLSSINMVRTATQVTPYDGGTVGSSAVRVGGPSVQLAAATARQALLEMAATQLKTTTGHLFIRDGVIQGPSGRVTYGQLIGGKTFNMKVSATAPLKSPADYTIVGKPIPRIDLAQKLTGADGPHQYLVNLQLPGMVHARFMRPPAFGSTIVSMNTAAAKKMAGVLAVITLNFNPKMKGWQAGWLMPEGQFVAVVAETENQALSALTVLEADTKWSASATLPKISTTEETAAYLQTLKVVMSKNEAVDTGDPVSAIAAAPTRLEAEYATPYQANGPIGPGCAIVDVKSGSATVYSGSQVPFLVNTAVSGVLGLPAAKVNVVQYDSAGSYGRGNTDDAAVEAALLSQIVNRPVRVQWMRHEEFIWSTQRTPTAYQFTGGVNAQGQLLGWTSEVWSDTTITAPFYAGATFFGGVLPIYATPHTTKVNYVASALRKGAMRGLGSYPTVFAHESFIDELAYASGTDPLAFRLKNLKDPRGQVILREAARVSGWTSHTKPRAAGTGQGIAFLHNTADGTVLAEIVNLTVDKSSGQVTVNKVTAVIDCGRVVNLNGARNQAEGGILQAASWALHEQLTFNTQTVTSVDWVSYPILRYEEVPDVVVRFMDHPDQPAWGMGEPPVEPMGAAIGNAIYDAIGVRIRATPFTAARVKSFMA